MHEIVNYIVDLVSQLGYLGIFIMMFLESTFFPFPSEVAMIPAGYLASKGEMSMVVAIITGTTGSLSGALFNYYLAKKYGRKGVLAFGKYFFFTEEKLDRMERYFREHGSFSTFVSRLIPAVRQFISLPAGLANMDIKKFSLYTIAGAGIWVIILALLGYFIGENEVLLKEYLHQIVIITLGTIVITTAVYIWRHKSKK
ncbi:putative integral membrane protein (dedA homolog) [hydrothermal vent metagenome]|uniref:Putative integral membrane protein (DedA homolog) n=1 Tax=hydrothermal vent metagenome TaxID=652676 RepID=A0A1W1BX05_9ZZZZ